MPQLVLKNAGTLPVLLLDGEHLEGAMQNRVLNATVLAAPEHETVIPVSCVERAAGATGGRLGSRRSGSRSAPEMAYSELRSLKTVYAAASARAGAGRQVDQGEVWADVERKRTQVKGGSSPTGAMRDAFRDRAADLRRIVDGVGRPDREHNGVMAFAGWRPLALDLFDRPETLAALWDRWSRGTRWMRSPTSPPRSARSSPMGSSRRRGRRREATAHEGVGLGTDVILTSPTSVADALTWEGAIVHLAAFPTSTDGHGSSRPRPRSRARGDRIARPTRRHPSREGAWFHDEGGER